MKNNQSPNHKFDLEERTTEFAKRIIRLCRELPKDSMNSRLVGQITGSAGSIGANYCEASEAESKKDFKNKIHICKKEAQETKHWLRMMAQCVPERKEEIREIWKECQELTLIFGKISPSLKN